MAASKLITLSHEASARVVACGGGVGTRLNRGCFTLGEIWTCETDFSHVRLGVMNDIGRATALGPVAVAAVARPQPEPARLTAVTFPHGSDVALPPVPGLARGRESWLPELAFSHWIPLRSLPRDDGGPGRLLHIRSLVARKAIWRGPGAGPYATTLPNPAPFTGRTYETFFQNGDRVENGRDLAVIAGQQGAGAIYTVQWRIAAAGATVQMVGDSIGQGVGSTNGYANFALLACAAVSTEQRPVHFLQSAISGERSADYLRAARHDLERGPVSIACIQTWSGNDVSASMSPALARAAADAAWHGAREYGDSVRRNGGVPIYLSAVPQPLRCPTPPLEAARLTSVARCHALAARGEFVLDLNGILGNGEAPVDYRPEFLTDHFHPSDAGQRAVASRLAPMLRAIVGLIPGGRESDPRQIRALP